MLKDEIVVGPTFEIEEEEEETFTLDLANKVAYSGEETIVIKDKVIDVKGDFDGDYVDMNEAATKYLEFMEQNVSEAVDAIEHVEIKATHVAENGTDAYLGSKEGMKFTHGVIDASYKFNLQDILVDTLTSKAISSLLQKHGDLTKEIFTSLADSRMDELSSMLETEIDVIMDKRRQELRACFNGVHINYDRIPKWAKSYVEMYIRDAMAGLASLTER